jgi:hypothetical protein
MVTQVTLLLETSSKALDLLNIVDLEDLPLAFMRHLLEEKSNKYGPLRMGMDAAACITLGEGGDEEWGALGGLEGRRRAEVDSILRILLFLQR